MTTINRQIYGYSVVVEELARHVFNRVEMTIRNHHRRRREMQAIRELQELNFAQLRDIGLTRGDLYQVSRMPAMEHATAELQRIARRTNSI